MYNKDTPRLDFIIYLTSFLKITKRETLGTVEIKRWGNPLEYEVNAADMEGGDPRILDFGPAVENLKLRYIGASLKVDLKKDFFLGNWNAFKRFLIVHIDVIDEANYQAILNSFANGRMLNLTVIFKETADNYVIPQLEEVPMGSKKSVTVRNDTENGILKLSLF